MFSGAGGMAEGARQAGFAVMAAVDNDPAAAQTLRLNRYSSRAGTPVSPQDQAPLVTADARTMDLTRWKGRVNLLTGDIPGEEWSRMGEMRGPEGRNNLWPAFIRAMRQVEPEVAVAEIVAGIVAGRFTDYRRYIMRAMAAPVVQPRPGESWQDHSSRLAVALASRDDARAERYDVQWVRLNAADYEGGPQVRQRVFFVAIRSDVEGLAGWSPPPPTHSKTALIRDQNEGGYWERHPDAPQHVREAKDLPDGMRLPPDDGLRPWVTIRDAIGEHLGDAPAREGAPGEIDDLDWPISTLSGRTTVVRRDDGTIAEVGLDGLAALQQYPDGYQFAGLLREQRRLIFDSTPVGLGRALFRSLAAGLYTAERPAGSGTARPPGPPATSESAPARRLVRRGPAPRPLSRGARRHRASRRGGGYDSPLVQRVLGELGLVKNAELWRPSARHEDMTTPGGRTRQGIVPDSTGPGYLVEIKGQGKVTAMRQIRLEHALAKRAGQKLWIITRAGARVNSKVSDLAEDTGGGVLFRLESGTYQDPHGNEVTIAPGMQVTGYQRWRPDDAVGGGAGTAASRGAPGDEERPGSPDGGDGGGLFVSQPGSPSNDGSAGSELSPAEDVDDTPFVDRVLRELGLTKNTRLWRAPPEVAAAKDGRTRRGIVPDARGRHYVVEIKDRRRLEFTNQIALEHLLATGSGRKLWIIAREGADVARGVVNNAEDTGGGVLIRLDSGTYQDFYGNQVAVGPRMKVTGYRGRRDVSPGRGGSGQGEGSDEDRASDGDQDNGDDIDWQPDGQDDPVRTRPATPEDPAGQIVADGSSDDEPLTARSDMQMLAMMANQELARRDAALSGMQALAEAANQEAANQEAARRDAALSGMQMLAEAANLDSARRESANLDSARRESARRESANLDSARRESARRESANLDSARRESANLDSARRESANLDSARRDAVRREVARLEEDRRARLQARRRQQQTRMDEELAAYGQRVAQLGIRAVNVPADGDCYFNSVIAMFGDQLAAFTGGLPPTPRRLRDNLIGAVRDDVARTTLGIPARYLQRFFPSTLTGPDPQAAREQLYRSLDDPSQWNTDAFDSVPQFSVEHWRLPAMTLLGPSGPRHIGPADAIPVTYLLYDGSHYTAARSGLPVARAEQLWNQPGLGDQEADTGPPPTEEAQARLQQEAGTYAAAFGLLRDELTELTGEHDALRSELARRGRQVITAFGERLAYPPSRDTSDRLGELYARLRDIVEQAGESSG
jgi:DNA (cytosine-5)-methyltransferase 1